MNRESIGNSQALHLEAIIDGINDAVILADGSGIILSWNAAASKMFQYKNEEAIGQLLTLIIPDRFKEGHDRGIKRVSSGGEHRVIGKTVELFGLRKDGTEFPIELSLSMTKDGDQILLGGIIRDCSERKKSEAAISEAEQKFRSITESANDAIISADEHGDILSWNTAAERFFGYTSEEVVGKPLSIIVPDEFKQLHDQGIARVSSGGEQRVIGKTVELAGLHKNGHVFPIELSLSTWLISDKRYYCGIVRDITQRKEIEENVKDAEMRFRSITESANDAIISADSKGNIISWNLTAKKMFGYKEEEALGKPLSIIVPEKYKKLHNAGIERVSSGGERHVIGKTVELEGAHKEGHVFPIELSLSTWEISGRRYYSGIIRDITERKKAEQEILNSRAELTEKALKLKEANEEVQVKNEQLQDLSNKLAKYLSQQVYKSIFQGTKDVKIESYRKNLTIFFSDIQGFTELTDRVESEVLTAILNKYLNEMSKIAIEFGGTIDKFIGDAIMIFFGDPETGGEKHDAIACVKMAIKMRERMIELRREWDDLGIIRPIQIRIGINSGFATVGNFGSEDRLDYTIVGGNVNLASRLESAAPADNILISHSTYSLVKDEILCEEREEVIAKGLAYPVKTYEVINVISDVNAGENSLQTALEGFNINIDFNKLSYTARLEAKEILQKAISKLK